MSYTVTSGNNVFNKDGEDSYFTWRLKNLYARAVLGYLRVALATVGIRPDKEVLTQVVKEVVMSYYLSGEMLDEPNMRTSKTLAEQVLLLIRPRV